MKERLLSIFSIIPAIFAAFCWGGGLILASLGLGTISAAYLSNLTRFKPFFVVLTAGMLYWSYRIIEKKNSNKITKIIFWISAVISVLIIYYPTILRLIYR